MSPEQQAHINRIIKKFGIEGTKKYAKGAEEYGTLLWQIPTYDILQMALEEAIDQVIYLSTAIEQMEQQR